MKHPDCKLSSTNAEYYLRGASLDRKITRSSIQATFLVLPTPATENIPTAYSYKYRLGEKTLTYENSHSGKLRDAHSCCLQTVCVPIEVSAAPSARVPLTQRTEKKGNPFDSRLSLSGWQLSRLGSHNKGRL